MTTGEQAAKDTQKEESSFKGCEEMMKMMCSCMSGKEEKINCEQLREKMGAICREMMKKGAQS